ncbi:hypothetical protein BOTBODRAFT_115299 [Botryobasidium botryosum FD-172 SS1]|uniref:Tc1-like transposase DDE domain-containing protein n=1 Tax=Botryobasidium botryosum (strain FD-172 SS1) TaxID=930990 RepID=A0A067M5E4_BOTB1|nr:hypothetical protein BOTBODRAFT_115299 [Botryobasidium botryosum FD-172 SS1]
MFARKKFISAKEVAQHLSSLETRERLNLPAGTIHERTAVRWLQYLGYSWRHEPKGQYKDGHEREDVVDYRQNVFLPAWMRLTEGLTAFDDGNESSVILWFHDECTFYANDCRTLRWVHEDEEPVPYPKGEGLSLMVADFASAQYGWLRAPDGSSEARILFRAGKERDGYLKAQNIQDQATLAMDILDAHYPGHKHVFIYDNAPTHLARAPNALSARRMPLHPPKKKNFLCPVKTSEGLTQSVRMEDGTFPDGTPQSLYFPEGHPQAGLFKGMKEILHERIVKGALLPDPSTLLAQCPKFKCPSPMDTTVHCCCRRILFNQPDFANRTSGLEEHCKARGYEVLFLPRFHCELNFIEQCWAYAKRIYREFPPSPTLLDLERNAVAALDSVPLNAMRNFFRRSFRFMDAYRNGLNGTRAAWACKKYRGHRVIPESLLADMEASGV